MFVIVLVGGTTTGGIDDDMDPEFEEPDPSDSDFSLREGHKEKKVAKTLKHLPLLSHREYTQIWESSQSSTGQAGT